MITASIVLFNTDIRQLERVIESYCPSDNRRLFLIDNGQASDKYIDYISRDYISYIHNGSNIGYGSAHNIGMKAAILMKSDYHLVLNPDLYFEPSIIDELIKYADENKDVVYILPKVIYPDGSLQYLCKLLPTPVDLIFRRFLPEIGVVKKNNDKYVLKDSGYDQIMNPPCLSGCFMFMRTEAIADNHIFFDESFFMYCEDFDLMRRLHKVGKTIFYPYVTIVHNHEKSSYKNKKMLWQHIRSACIYFNKYGWLFDKERREMNSSFWESLYK